MIKRIMLGAIVSSLLSCHSSYATEAKTLTIDNRTKNVCSYVINEVQTDANWAPSWERARGTIAPGINTVTVPATHFLSQLIIEFPKGKKAKGLFGRASSLKLIIKQENGDFFTELD